MILPAQGPSRIHLVLEYLDGGDLSQLLQGGRLGEAAARHFLVQMCAGLQELRRHNYIHVRAPRPPPARRSAPVSSPHD